MESFTREQILEALTLHPCHVTGTHDPTHTERVCDIQRAKAYAGVLVLLGISEEDLPRALHDDCYYCNEPQRELVEWADD